MYCYPSEFKIQIISNLYPIKVVKLPDIATIEAIVKYISKYTEIPIAGLKSKGRERENCEARMIALHFMALYIPSLTLKQLGAVFNRHYSTVINSAYTFEDLKDTNKAFKSKLEFFERLFCEMFNSIELNNSHLVE